MMRDFWDFVREFIRTLISKVTGGILAAFLTTWTIADWTFHFRYPPPAGVLWASLASYLLASAFGVWQKERKRALGAEANLAALGNAKNPIDSERNERIKRKFFGLDKWNQMLVREMMVVRSMTNNVAIDFLRKSGHDPGPHSRPIEDLNSVTDWFPFNNGEYTVSPAVFEELKAIISETR